MKKTAWIWGSLGLLALALLLRYGFSIRYPAYALGALAVGLVFWHFRKNKWALLGMLGGAAVVLHFALRGYAYWAYLCLFIAALILLHSWLPPFWWRVVLILTCLGVVYFCIVEVPIIKNARTDKDPERKYLVVLGAAVYGDEPSLTLVRRMEGALDYLNAYPDSVAIVSGGMGPGETVTEAQAMHDWLVGHGVAEERIILEAEATSTLENLSNSYEIIRARGDEPDGNVAVVSSAYHLYRAKEISRLLGVEAAGVAAPWGYFFVMLNYFIREAFGVTKLWVLGP